MLTTHLLPSHTIPPWLACRRAGSRLVLILSPQPNKTDAPPKKGLSFTGTETGTETLPVEKCLFPPGEIAAESDQE